MTLNEKDAIIAWNDAVEIFKSKPDDVATTTEAAEKLEALISSNPQQGISKLCYNVSVLRGRLGDRQTALKYLDLCLTKDPHNAMAYYQRAVLQYQLTNFMAATKDFQKCVSCMRRTMVIDYTQLGLRCKLYQHEAIFNEGACHLRLGHRKNCVDALFEVKSLMEGEGGATLRTLDINSPLQDAQNGANEIQIIEVGQDKLYSPPITKLNNLAKKNYLGKAKVVSSVNSGDTFAGFEGPKQLALPKHMKKKPPDRPSSPRPMTPPPQQAPVPDKVTKAGTGSGSVLDELVFIQKQKISPLARTDAPSYPPPKPLSRPSPLPRSTPASQGNALPPARLGQPNSQSISHEPSADSTSASGGLPSKPVAPRKPTMCKIELLAGELLEILNLPLNTNYFKLMDSVKKAFGYPEGSYTLWYLNREGTYTAIENQTVVEHVWKWKLVDNQLTIYVFGV